MFNGRSKKSNLVLIVQGHSLIVHQDSQRKICHPTGLGIGLERMAHSVTVVSLVIPGLRLMLMQDAVYLTNSVQ